MNNVLTSIGGHFDHLDWPPIEPARKFGDAGMVGEQDRLSPAPEFGEQVKRVTGPLVVETGEQIVADEWQRLAGAAFEQGQAQRQKKLVARAFAEALDLYALAAGAPGDEDGTIVVVIAYFEFGEIFCGRDREQHAGARDQRVLRGVAMTLDGARGEFGGDRPQEPPLRDI